MLLINAALVPVESPRIDNGYIRILDQKIAAFGPMPAPNPDEGEEVLDLCGLTAYPGFVDGHCHIGMFADGLGFEGDDGNEETDPVTPHLRAIDAVNPMDRCFQEALEQGITTVVTGPGSANPIAGQFCAMKTFGRRVDDMVIREPVAMKFALGENPKTVYNDKNQTPNTRMATAALIREELHKAQRYGEDLEAAQEDEDADEPDFDAKCEALLPLLAGEIKAHIHAHRADDIFTALRFSKEFGLAPVLVHCTEGHLAADILGEEKASAICGPLIGSRCKPELVHASLANPAILSQNGVEVSICTDHPELPIQCLGISAGLAVREGMDYDKALAAVTIVPARQAGVDSRVGSIQVEKDADLAFFDCDPLSLTAKPKLVLVDGKIVFSKM